MITLLSGRMSWVMSQDWPVDQHVLCGCTDTDQCAFMWLPFKADLVVTVGWRHIVPLDLIDRTPLGVVGFHSAKLPEYPGRAPVPWAILRGDATTENTMLYLTSEPDAGDIIDSRVIPVTTPEEMNRRMGETAAEMLRQHLPALLDGTAPRTPQDRTRRGPLTTADGWARLAAQARGERWVFGGPLINRRKGGPVHGGTYLVGERGPERFAS